MHRVPVCVSGCSHEVNECNALRHLVRLHSGEPYFEQALKQNKQWEKMHEVKKALGKDNGVRRRRPHVHPATVEIARSVMRGTLTGRTLRFVKDMFVRQNSDPAFAFFNKDDFVAIFSHLKKDMGIDIKVGRAATNRVVVYIWCMLTLARALKMDPAEVDCWATAGETVPSDRLQPVARVLCNRVHKVKFVYYERIRTEFTDRWP